MKGLKGYLPRSLFGRSLLILILPVVLVQLVTGYVFINRHWDKVVERLSEATAGDMAVTIFEAQQALDAGQSLEPVFQKAINFFDMAVSYKVGASLPVPQPPEPFGWEIYVQSIFDDVLDRSVSYPFVSRFNFIDKWVFVHVKLEGGVLSFSFPARRLFSSSGYIFLLWVGVVSLLLLLISVLFMRNQVRPIRKLAAAAERFGKGRDVSNFRVSGAREVRQAGLAFSNMAERIKRQIEQRTLMLAGVSHDLRTPLTRLKLALSMMGDGQDAAEMRTDINQMEVMLQGYLDFVRDGMQDEAYAPVGLSYFQDILGRYDFCSLKDISADEGWVLTLRPAAFERALVNLLENAARYGGRAVLQLDCGEDEFALSLEDDGPGLDPALYEDVFKPFFRGDSSRHGQDGNVGLGLSVVMDIVHAHGGRIWLEKADIGGMRVNIILPL